MTTCNGLTGVLIVDDDPIVRLVASSLFTSIGADHVHCASNGQEAIAWFDEFGSSIEFILCDLNMPEMDGLQLLRHFGERKYGGALVLLSGENSTVLDMSRRLAVQHRLNLIDVLNKPLDAKKLEGLIRSPKFAVPSEPKASEPRISACDLDKAIADGRIMPFFNPRSVLKPTKSSALRRSRV